jgi:hypothetical protein
LTPYQGVECHDAVCLVCRASVTITPAGIELGHQRARSANDQKRCPHRPACVDPKGGEEGF